MPRKDIWIGFLHMNPDFSAYKIHTLHSQCQINFGSYLWEESYSLIRASSLGDTILTAWIDGRDGDPRVYGSFFDVSIVTGIEQEDDRMIIPEDFSISWNYPNPFNSSTTMQFRIRERATVKLMIYDITGRLISILVNDAREAGDYTVNWNGMDFLGKPATGGVYFCQFYVITQDKKVHNIVRKMILLR
jgi:hypothetical protein